MDEEGVELIDDDEIGAMRIRERFSPSHSIHAAGHFELAPTSGGGGGTEATVVTVAWKCKIRSGNLQRDECFTDMVHLTAIHP